MEVHVYASYKRSPVGFQLGSFSYQEGRTDDYDLKKDNSNSLVYKIFEQGYILSANGLMPDKLYNIILEKNIEHTYDNHDEFGKIVYVNIAFQFSSEKEMDEYNRFCSGYYSLSIEELSEKLASFIVPDKSNKEYGLYIDAMRFNGFINEVNQRGYAKSENSDCFEIKTRSSTSLDYSEKISTLFGVDFEKEDSKYVFPPKKKHRRRNRTFKQSSRKKLIPYLVDLISKYKRILIIVGKYILSFIGIAGFLVGIIYSFTHFFKK